jgi:hypothetical protein
MGEVACPDKVQPFYSCVPRDFFEVHAFARCPAESTVNVQVSDYSQASSLCS